ncbi:eIF3 p110, partial [Haematococcus lacustris]
MFTGPPENVRDHVMSATRSLMRGDWRKAYAYVTALTVWGLVPSKEALLAMLREKLQAEALRTYLFTYSPQYNSLSLDQLCTMFDLPEKKVYSIVSKMMIAEELQGSWDQPTRTIVMHSMDASRMQQLAVQFADKAL